MTRSLLFVVPLALAFGTSAQAQYQVPYPVAVPSCTNCPTPNVDASAPLPERGIFESDHAFDGFIGPISNPIYSKDPRSLTEARLLYISNWIPAENPLGSGDVQVAAMQLRLALTERLTLIADKDGYAFGNFGGLPNPDRDGWLNLAVGLKYTFIRDVENQLLVAGGVMYEIPLGSSQVFQDQGDGVFTFFLSGGKEFAGSIHALFNVGYNQPVNETYNSPFFYMQLHLDKQMFGWFYPLVEVNWFHYTGAGNWGIPSSAGEFDGLINIGTTNVAGNDLVTMALGAKIKPCKHLEMGCAWEFPLSNRQDFLQDRLLCDLILRY